jgi:purine-nucleoside phosphorylase
MLETINQTVSYIRSSVGYSPEIAIILGTGLGGMVKHIEVSETLPFGNIPGFLPATVDGHEGKLIFGHIGQKKVVAMKGRIHFFEGYSMKQITFPIRIFKFLGVKYLFLSNASGALNPEFEVGDMMIIEDHINLMPNPLIGQHSADFGERFSDMSEAYNRGLIRMAEKIAKENLIHLRKGCYVGVTGPSFETSAEYKYCRLIGGDAVGMSTVPEVITARQMDLSCFAVSVITNLGVPGKITPVMHHDVLHNAEMAEPQLAFLFNSMIIKL